MTIATSWRTAFAEIGAVRQFCASNPKQLDIGAIRHRPVPPLAERPQLKADPKLIISNINCYQFATISHGFGRGRLTRSRRLSGLAEGR
jgi:hypothetical protein